MTCQNKGTVIKTWSYELFNQKSSLEILPNVFVNDIYFALLFTTYKLHMIYAS